MSKTIHALAQSGVYLKDRHAYLEGKEPLVFHCHHYNCFLQAVIEDARHLIDPYPFLVDCAHSVVYHQLAELKNEGRLGTAEVLELAQLLFQKYGFGIIEIDATNERQGRLTLPFEHYGIGWLSRFGERDRAMPGVAFFARGFIEAMIEVAYDLPKGSVHSYQTRCLSYGDPNTQIEYLKKEARELPQSPQEGVFTPFVPLSPDENLPLDYIGIRDAVLSMPLNGAEESGLIDAFGVLLTRMYANYYGLISFHFIQKLKAAIGDGGMQLARQLLREAGHVCGFNTLGGIMESPEWNALIKPNLKSKEDWLHGITAVMNALGWGVLRIQELIPNEKFVLRVDSDYESNAFLKISPDCSEKVAFLYKGVTAALMNLIYHGDITQCPTLDADYYQKIFQEGNYFLAEQDKDRYLKAPYITCVAQRIQEV